MAAAFPNGTKKFFNMATAPTGWTKDTGTYDHAINIIGVGSSTVSGGLSNFTTVHPGTNLTASASASWYGNPTDYASLDIPSHSHTGSVSHRSTGSYGTNTLGYYPAPFPAYNYRLYPYTSAGNSSNFSENYWSDEAWSTTLVSMGNLVPGTRYSIASLGTTTPAQWNTVSGGTLSSYNTPSNLAIGDVFTAATNGAGLGTGQVRKESPQDIHNHTTGVSGSFTSLGTRSFNLGVKYVDFILAVKNGPYGVTFASLSPASASDLGMTKGTSVSITWNTPTATCPVGSTLYWTINNVGYTGALSGLTTLSGSFVTTGATFVQSITVPDNGFWDSKGSFIVQIRANSLSDSIMAMSSIIYVIEPADPTVTFTVTPTTIAEGALGTFTFTTTRLRNGHILYYKINNTTTSNEDFVSTTGTVVVNNNTGTITVNPRIDLLIESTETFTVTVELVPNYSLATSASVSLTNVSPTVTFTSIPVSINSYSTGAFTITTTNVPSGTLLYWAVNVVSPIVSTDFVSTTGTFYIYNNTGTFYVTSNSAFIGTARTFTVSVQNSTAQTFNTSSSVTINPVTVSFVSPITSMSEGQTVNYTINTTNVPNGSKLLYKIASTSPETNIGFNNMSGYITIKNNVGIFSVTPTPNVNVEGVKTFNLDVYDFNGINNLTATGTGVGYSTYFDGSTNGLTTSTSYLPTTLGTEFTFEGWFYSTRPTTSGRNSIICTGTSSTADILLALDNTNPGQIRFDVPTARTNVLASTVYVPINTWAHIAITRTTANLYTLYLNGVNVSSGTQSAYTLPSTTKLGGVGQANPWQGYMYNIRVVNKVVYTGNFNVPAGLLTATQSEGANISAITAGQTVLLACQNSTLVDNSGTQTLTFAGTFTTSNTVLPKSSMSAGVTVSITDTFTPSYYFITPAQRIVEGLAASLQFISNFSTGTMYWTINNISTSNVDFNASTVSGTITLNSSNTIDSTSIIPRYLQTLTLPTAVLDQIIETDETFTVSLRTDSVTGPVVATSEIITVGNYTTVYFPTFTSLIVEGTTVIYNVNFLNIPTGSTITWTINHITTSSTDFAASSGTFINNSGTTALSSGRFSIQVLQDNTIENDETFTITISSATYGFVLVSDIVTVSAAAGQIVFATPSNSTVPWTVPLAANYISVVAIGQGGGGSGNGIGGGGGSLMYVNYFPVTPGYTYNVRIGYAGSGLAGTLGGSGQNCFIIDPATNKYVVYADGGNGSNGTTGIGATAPTSTFINSAMAQTTNLVAYSGATTNGSNYGGAGTYTANGIPQTTQSAASTSLLGTIPGGGTLYGAGGTMYSGAGTGNGLPGAIRIMWWNAALGTTYRAYPSTNVADM